MKLLLVNYEFPPVGAGAGNATDHTARQLTELGHDVVVLTAAHGHLPRKEKRHGYTVLRAPALRRRADHSTPLEMLSFTLGGTMRALSLTRTWQPDACLCYFTLPCAPVGWVLKHRLGIPYAALLRGGDVPGFEPERMARMHRLCGPAIRALWQDADAVSANCDWLANLARKELPGLDVSVIPNGVDTTEFCPRPSPEHGAETRLLFTGRLASQKGVDVLLRALALAKQEPDAGRPHTADSQNAPDERVPHGQAAQGRQGHTAQADSNRTSTADPSTTSATRPQAPLRLDIVGDGPLRPELERMTAQLGLSDSVTFHGWMQREDLPAAFAAADIFVLPSLDEGMPNVLLEAMASGLPAVATSAGGSAELVISDATGLLVPPGNHRALAEALQVLTRDPDLGRRMGRKARARAEQIFSWRRVALGMEQLARDMVRKHMEAPNTQGARR